VIGPQVADASELSALDLDMRLGGYAARDAVWVPGWPVVVSRDFDFGIALAIDVVGAGVAAAKRRAGNADLAKRLASLSPIEPQAVLETVCARRPTGCQKLAGVRVRVYAVLFGEHTARVRVVLEMAETKPSIPIYATISDAHPAQAFAESHMLETMFESGLTRIADLIDTPLDGPALATGQCASGDASHLSGKMIAHDQQSVVLMVSDPAEILLSCPLDSFSASTSDNEQTTPSGSGFEAH